MGGNGRQARKAFQEGRDGPIVPREEKDEIGTNPALSKGKKLKGVFFGKRA